MSMTRLFLYAWYVQKKVKIENKIKDVKLSSIISKAWKIHKI